MKKDKKTLSHVLPPIRCTELELQTIKKRAEQAQMTTSRFVRECATKRKVVMQNQPSNYDPSIAYELKRIGVNLNQIAKKMHEGSIVSTEIKSLRSKLEQTLDKVINL